MLLTSDGCLSIAVGMLPRDQVSQAQVNSYLDQERVKRRDMLQKFLAECQKSRVNI